MKFHLKFEGSRLQRRHGHMQYVPIQDSKVISAPNLASARLAAEMVLFRSGVTNARAVVERAHSEYYHISAQDGQREKLVLAYSEEDARAIFEKITGKKAR